MPKRKQKKSIDMQSLLFITILVLILGGGVFVLIDSLRGEPVKVLNFDYAKQPSIGNPKAPVKLMEFGDFKCPSCKQFHDEIYPQLKKEYIDTGKVQMFFANNQFIGPDSITAGMVGESLYKQKSELFWKYYDVIYKNQKPENQLWATPKYLLDLVKKHIPKADAKKVEKELMANKYKKDVVAETTKAQKIYKITSVPEVFINGKVVETPLDYQAIKEAIESELKEK